MLTLTAAINNSKLNNFLILDLYYRQLRARIDAINRRENFFFFPSYATNSTNLFPLFIKLHAGKCICKIFIIIPFHVCA